MARYKYSAFGLTLASELDCPGLIPTSGKADIRVEFGRLHHIPLEDPHLSRNYNLGVGKLLINIQDVARYQVTHGRSIIIDPYDGVSAKELRLFLLGSALGAILYQRGYLPIHGSTVVLNGEAVVFAGHAGQGKSTLVANFVARGYPLLSDDICAIKIRKNAPPLVMPGFPYIKLWQDSLEAMGKVAEHHVRIRPNENKYFFPVADAHYPQPLPLKRIYLLQTYPESDVRLQLLGRLDSLIALKNHTYKLRMMKKMGLLESHYYLSAQVVAATRVTRLIRAHDYARLDRLIGTVIADKTGKNEV